jgi:hypothetical protein
MADVHLRSGFFLGREIGRNMRDKSIKGRVPADYLAQMAVAGLSVRFGVYGVGTTIEVDGGLGLVSWIPGKA